MTFTLVFLVFGYTIYYQRRNRRLRNDPFGSNINPGRDEPDFDIPTAFSINPITPAIAVTVTDTGHITAKIVETNETVPSNAIPSELTLSDHPIPSAPPMESADNTSTA